MARIGEGECSASECSLICNDYWEAGYGRILMVPRVKLAYDRVWIFIFISALLSAPLRDLICHHRKFSILFIPRGAT